MRGWVIYQMGEKLSTNANEKEILLAISSQETQPILATPPTYHPLVSPNAGPTRPRLGLHPIKVHDWYMRRENEELIDWFVN